MAVSTIVTLDGEGGSFQIEMSGGGRPAYYLVTQGRRLLLGGLPLEYIIPRLLAGLRLTERDVEVDNVDEPLCGYMTKYVLGFLPLRYALYIGVRGSQRLLYFQDGGDTGVDEDGYITLSEEQCAQWRAQLTALLDQAHASKEFVHWGPR